MPTVTSHTCSVKASSWYLPSSDDSVWEALEFLKLTMNEGVLLRSGLHAGGKCGNVAGDPVVPRPTLHPEKEEKDTGSRRQNTGGLKGRHM